MIAPNSLRHVRHRRRSLLCLPSVRLWSHAPMYVYNLCRWNWLLLLVVALVSVVVFRFCVRKVEKSGAVNPSIQLIATAATDACLAAPLPPSSQIQHHAVHRVPASANLNAPAAVRKTEPPDKASTFVAEFQHAVQLKTVNMLAEAGQNLTWMPNAHFSPLRVNNAPLQKHDCAI